MSPCTHGTLARYHYSGLCKTSKILSCDWSVCLILLTLCLLYLCKVSPIIFVVKQVSKGGDQQKDLTNGLVWHPVDLPVAA